MKKTLLSLSIAGLLLSAVAVTVGSKGATGGPTKPDTKPIEVTIDNFSFGPQFLTIPAGTTVTWINRDDVPHTVASSEGNILKSPVLDTDEKFSYTFTTRGTYPYYCSIHPKMTAKVVVQ